jgi:hypothetical protein
MAAKDWIRLTLIAALVGGFVLVQHHRHTRATADKVETAVRNAPPRADHVVVGGRTFHLSRHGVRGGSLLVATASDTRGLIDVSGLESDHGRVALMWAQRQGGPLRLRFIDADGHQSVIVGSPATERTRRAMAHLAIRLAS